MTFKAESFAPAPPRVQALSRLRAVWPSLGAIELVFAVTVLALCLGMALFPALFTGLDPLMTDPLNRLKPPSATAIFGTDPLGRDLWTRTVYGAANSMKATAIAVAIGLACGTALGLVSGMIGGLIDSLVMRVVDVLLAIPGLLVSLMVITALGFGIVQVAIAVGVAAIAGFARVMRAEVLRIRNAPYVEAAIACGVTPFAIAIRTILPRAIGSVLMLAAVEFGTAILAVSALSFLGFGAAPPAPEWGLLIADGRNYIASAWWLTALPGLVIVAAVVSTNILGRHLKAIVNKD